MKSQFASANPTSPTRHSLSWLGNCVRRMPQHQIRPLRFVPFVSSWPLLLRVGRSTCLGTARGAARGLFALVAVLLLVAGCDILGPAEFDPSGTTFTLNSDINVVSITGSPQTDPNGPMTMAMTVSSNSGSATSAVLPAGLFFRRRDSGNQHVILLKDQTIATNASGNRATQLGAFCCNRTLRQPGIGDTFDIGPITDDADLQRIISLVRSKDFSDGNDMFMVQRAVWMVTDSTGLTQAYVDSINALPAAR